MKTELDVLDQLKRIIAEKLGSYLEEEGDLPSIDEHTILIDFPDVDSMRRQSMIYIQPDYESLEPISVLSDLATMHITLFILCKGAASEKLIRRVFSYYTGLYCLLRSNQSLDGFVDFLSITDMDYYPSVTASSSVSAIEVKINIQWTKDFEKN